MKIITFVVAVAISIGAHAQTAKVIALSPEDAKVAKELIQAQDALTKRKAEFEASIRAKYLTAQKGESYTSTFGGERIRSGWDYGFEFSEDWKYIVPAPTPRYQTTLSTGCSYSTTPAIGWQ